MNDVSQYKKLGDIEHVLLRPATYIGSTVVTTANNYVVDNGKIVEQSLTFSPALLKMFDEIVTNSVDASIKNEKLTKIDVGLNQLTGEISIEDNGGIPVVEHPEYGLYVPAMIFGELRTGSNFSDDNREGGGMNGLGAKLTSIFSKEFTIDTCDGKKRFTQTFRDNLSIKEPHVIRTSNLPGTKITFMPDYDRLQCELDPDNISTLTKRVYDIAGCNPHLNISLNGKPIKFKNFHNYVDMYVDDSIYECSDKWEVAIASSEESAFKQVSFVNNICVFNGGSHVDYVSDQIVNRIREFIKKKHKVDVKPANIKQHMFLFIKCKINAPLFNSQTKEFLVSDKKNFGTSYSPSDKFIKKVLESDVVEKVLNWVEGEKRRAELAELKKLNKTVQSSNALKKILKFEDANSHDRSKCTLFLTEGDSACKTILGARNPEFHGAFPLKGKPLNVRDVEIKKLILNQEFTHITTILGLQVGVKVNSPDDLRFSVICILSDQDADGMHIRGLLINLFNEFWPEIIEMGMLRIMSTPLIIATLKGKKYEFFQKQEYMEWSEKNPGNTKHYYKGLGGFMTNDFKAFLQKPEKYMVKLTVEDKTDIEALNMAFSKDKGMSDLRKDWLAGAL